MLIRIVARTEDLTELQKKKLEGSFRRAVDWLEADLQKEQIELELIFSYTPPYDTV